MKRWMIAAFLVLISGAGALLWTTRQAPQAQALKVLLIPADGGTESGTLADYQPIFNAVSRSTGLTFDLKVAQSYGAVVEGMRIACGEWIVVMDADLQHDEIFIRKALFGAKAPAQFRSVGAVVRYTLYPELGHGTWNKAYNEPD